MHPEGIDVNVLPDELESMEPVQPSCAPDAEGLRALGDPGRFLFDLDQPGENPCGRDLGPLDARRHGLGERLDDRRLMLVLITDIFGGRWRIAGADRGRRGVPVDLKLLDEQPLFQRKAVLVPIPVPWIVSRFGRRVLRRREGRIVVQFNLLWRPARPSSDISSNLRYFSPPIGWSLI